ncbi:hypothetical protein EC991_009083, partial [Linnemannia zychae]
MQSDTESQVQVLLDLYLQHQASVTRGIYIEPQGYEKELGITKTHDDTSLDAPDRTSSRPLVEIAQEFIGGEKQVLLIMGDPGSGKTSFARQLESILWHAYSEPSGPEKRIPLLINLSDYPKAALDLMGQVLKFKGLNHQQILNLKRYRQFVLICDGYDEAQVSGNIYNSNKFNHPGQWRVKFIVFCRSDKVGRDSDGRFQPEHSNRYSFQKLDLFQKAATAPFTFGQIKEYVHEYVLRQHRQYLHHIQHDQQNSGGHQTAQQQLQHRAQEARETQMSAEVFHEWDEQGYMKILADIPNLMELVRNPYILSFVLRLLPEFVGSTKGAFMSRVSFDALYKRIFDNWMTVAKVRLNLKKMSGKESTAFNELLDSGFSETFMETLKELAVDIYSRQAGDPVVKYSHYHDKDKQQEQWKTKFFGSHTEARFFQESVPLVRSGPYFRFAHPSLLQYLYSLAMFDPYNSDIFDSENPQRGAPEYLSMSSSGALLQRDLAWRKEQRVGHQVQYQSSEQTWALEVMLKNAKALEKNHKLGVTNIATRSMAIQFLADRVQSNPVFMKQLVETVRESRSNVDDEDQTLAANVMTILVRSGMRFNSADLQGIRIRGANLTGGEFDSADLRGADLSEVTFSKSWLRGARLEGARLANANFGEHMLSLEDEPITAAYSPDGKHYAVVFERGSIGVYDTTTWEQTSTLDGFTSGIVSIAFAPDHQQLAFGDMKGVLRTWIFTGTLSAPTFCDGHNGGISDIAYSTDGQLIATASQDGFVRIFEISSGRPVEKLSGHDGGVSSVSFSSDNKFLVSGDSDGVIILWCRETGKLEHHLAEHQGPISKVLFSPNGTQIASSSFDKTVRVWSITGNCQRTYVGHLEGVTSIAYSPNDEHIVSCSEDSAIRMWNSRSGSTGPIFRGHTDHVVSIAYSPDGKHFVTCGRDKKLRRWDCPAATKGAVIFGHTNTASSGMFSYSTVKRHEGDSDKTLQPTQTQPCWAKTTVHVSFDKRTSSIVVSLSGSLVASASRESVYLKDKDPHAPTDQLTLTGHSKNVTCIAFSPDGKHIASGSEDKTIRIFNVSSGKLACQLMGHKSAVSSVEFSSTGDRIVSCSRGGNVRLWDSSNLVESTEDSTADRLLETLAYEGDRYPLVSVAISADSRWVAAGGNDTAVRVWDTRNPTGTSPVTLRGNDAAVNCVTFSPDNVHLASGGSDGYVRIWDVEKNMEECVMKHGGSDGGSVKCLTYSPSGRQIASGGDNKKVKIWDVSTGATDPTLEHEDSVICLRFSKDETQLWAGSVNKKVYVHTDIIHHPDTADFVHHADTASTAEFSKDCEQVAWSLGGKDVQLWNTSSGVPEKMLKGHSDCVERLLFSRVQNIIATASRDGRIGLWDSQTGKILRWLEGTIGESAGIMFSPISTQITTYSGNRLRLMNMSITESNALVIVGEEGTLLRESQGGSNINDQSDSQRAPVQEPTLIVTERSAHNVSSVTALMYSPDGKEIAVGTADEAFLRFDTESGSLLGKMVGHSSIITSIAYSFSGDMIVTGSEDKTLRVWRRKSGVSKLELRGHKKGVTSVAISPYSQQVASGSADNTIRLWSSTFGGLGQILSGHTGSVLCIAYSPDGRFLASGSEDRTMRLWNPISRVLLTTVKDFTTGVKSIRWRAIQGGHYLLTGCEGNPLRLWELVEEEGT